MFEDKRAGLPFLYLTSASTSESKTINSLHTYAKMHRQNVTVGWCESVRHSRVASSLQSAMHISDLHISFCFAFLLFCFLVPSYVKYQTSTCCFAIDLNSVELNCKIKNTVSLFAALFCICVLSRNIRFAFHFKPLSCHVGGRPWTENLNGKILLDFFYKKLLFFVCI